MYGFQWMHFGAEYKDLHTDYTGQGIHQLADCIDKIINNPDDRRIVMSAWTPKDLDMIISTSRQRLFVVKSLQKHMPFCLRRRRCCRYF